MESSKREEWEPERAKTRALASINQSNNRAHNPKRGPFRKIERAYVELSALAQSNVHGDTMAIANISRIRRRTINAGPLSALYHLTAAAGDSISRLTNSVFVYIYTHSASPLCEHKKKRELGEREDAARTGDARGQREWRNKDEVVKKKLLTHMHADANTGACSAKYAHTSSYITFYHLRIRIMCARTCICIHTGARPKVLKRRRRARREWASERERERERADTVQKGCVSVCAWVCVSTVERGRKKAAPLISRAYTHNVVRESHSLTRTHTHTHICVQRLVSCDSEGLYIAAAYMRVCVCLRAHIARAKLTHRPSPSPPVDIYIFMHLHTCGARQFASLC